MTLLNIKNRQIYLKTLGFYSGVIDGKEGPKTKEAYLKLQKKYFTRKSDIDGKYGKNTNILLINAYLVKTYTKNFKLTELKCKCKGKYCTGYPAILDKYVLTYLQELRNKYGAITITSGLRCKTHNKNVGGVSGSRHLSGKAFDIKRFTFSSLSKRKEVMKEFIKKPQARYTYCKGWYMNKSTQGYEKGSTMGNEIHIDTK